MLEPALSAAWHLHLCRTAAHWRGGQFARAHTEFLRLLAHAGRTPLPVFVTIWTDEVTYWRYYEHGLAALGLAALPQGMAIRIVELAADRELFVDATDVDGQPAAEVSGWLARWEDEVARQIDAANLERGEMFPDFPPAWLADYPQTPFCMLLAAYPASSAQHCRNK